MPEHPRSPVHKAAVLAAGRGKRLGSLTESCPKPLLLIDGVPILDRILSGLVVAGIADLVLVVGYLGDAIREHVGDGRRFGAQVEYIVQDGRQGTGAALRLAGPFAGGDPILMAFGDILIDPANYAAMLGAYRSDIDALIGINYMADVSAGAAVYREAGRVVRLIEKPGADAPRCNWNQAGVSVFGPAVWPALDRLTPSARGEYELTAAMCDLVASGKSVWAHELQGFWSDIGTPEDLADAEIQWARR